MNLCTVSLMLLFFMFASGCTKGSVDETEVILSSGQKLSLPKASTLRLRVAGEPPSMDWQQADDIPSVFILENLMEGLLRYDFSVPGKPAVAPGLAKEWKVSADGKKYQFRLRGGVKWSDGVPFTARHAVDAWKRTLTKETAAPYSRFLFNVKNGRCFFDGKCTFDQVGIKVPSDGEIHIELEKPVSYFPFLLAHFSSHPIRLDLIEKHGTQWTDPGKMVTLGGFTLKAWEHDKLIVLERNPHYYQAYPGGVEHVLIYMVEEWVTAFNLYSRGTIDYAEGIPTTEVKALESHPGFKRITRMASTYFGFNVSKPPADNLNLRKAIAHSLDRNEMVGLIQGGRNVLNSLVPAELVQPGHAAIVFDPEKGREYLRKSGIKPPIKLTYRFGSNEDNRRIAENIQAQLKKNLGIEVEITGLEFKTYVKNQRTDPTHIFPMGWVADYPDPSVFFGLFTSGSLNNTPRWKSAKYDSFVASGDSAPMQQERNRHYLEAQKLIVEEDFAIIPTYTSVLQYLLNPRVQGLVVNPRGLIDLRPVSIREK
jgi:oligopeptide transport system substrate-binding protein